MELCFFDVEELLQAVDKVTCRAKRDELELLVCVNQWVLLILLSK